MNKREKEISRNILKLLGRRYIKEKRSRSISIIVAIFLASMFITCLLVAFTGIKSALADYNIYQFGTLAHAQIYGLSQDEYEQIKEYDNIKETVYSLMLGTLTTKVADGRNYYFEYAQDKKFEWEKKTLTGHLPENSNDIVLSTGLIKQLGLDYTIGQNIELTWKSNGEKYTDVFSLSGYYESENVTTTEGHYEGWHIPGTYENIYVSKKYVQTKLAKFSQTDSKALYLAGQTSGAGLIQLDIKFKHGFNLQSNCGKLTETFHQQVYVNPGYLQKDVLHIDFTIITLYGIVILFVSFLAFWIIFSMFQLSITEDIHFWGLLQTLGTTEEQFAFFLKQQIIQYCIIEIILGEVLGTVFGNMIMPVILACFNGTINYKPVISPFSLLFSAIICIWITKFSCSRIAKKAFGYSSVEIINIELFENKKFRKKKKYNLGKFRCCRFAWKRITCNLRTFWSNIIPTTVFLIILMCTVTILKSVDTFFYIDNEIGNIEIGIFQKEIKESSIKDCSIYIDEWKKEMQEPLNWHEIGILDIKLQPEKTEEIFKTKKIQKYLLEHHLVERMTILDDFPELYLELIGMNENIAEKIKVTEGTFDKESFATGRYVLLINEQTNGMTISDENAYLYDNPAKGCYSTGDKINIYGKEYEVMATVDVPSYLKPYTIENEIPFIMKDTEVKTLDNAYCVYGSIYCGKDSSAAEKEARAVLSSNDEYKKNIEVISLEVIKQDVALFSDLFTIIARFVSIFLGSILLLYIINTTIFQVKSQKKIIGMLISIGMQEKQLALTWIFERVYEAITETILVTVIGSILSYYVIKNFCDSTSILVYKYSIIPVFILNIGIIILIIVLIIFEFIKLIKKCEVRELLLIE